MSIPRRTLTPTLSLERIGRGGVALGWLFRFSETQTEQQGQHHERDEHYQRQGHRPPSAPT